MHNEGRNVNPIFEAGLKKLDGYYNLTTDVPAYRFATSEWLYYSAIVTGIPARTRGVENEPKNVQIGPEMKEIWSITVNGPYLLHFWSDLDVLGLVLNATGTRGYTCDNR
jgi:hypothetical protein